MGYLIIVIIGEGKNVRVINFKLFLIYYVKNFGVLGGEIGEVWVFDFKLYFIFFVDLIVDVKVYINMFIFDQLVLVKVVEDLENWK